MPQQIPDPIEEMVDGSRAVKIADYNPFRKFINIWAGDSYLYFGSRNVRASGVGNRIPPNGQATIDATDSDQNKGEVWVIRVAATSGSCAFTEENANG
ncbi:MAG: hypothetical protein JKY60_20195 [Kordiimonadaceae bacterium]|nr:hypothetical protein [Kordiimonadaceae bacterium]